MQEKKIRGMKRRTNTMIKRIEEHTKTFPSTFQTLHVQEVIHDEGECYKKEIWFIGELA
ncbi:DUF3916 domain-containing protein [Bacillus cereus]|uniref:DUF3916 domain-containing protein n=1 Tax=Bacillus cereus TaxID=1396 RepID=UPI00027AC1D3|nr:DUF3916 domain-containing protein [Bacillus cereus]EJS77108.1 hypothetical protein ICY_01734 [Bacillus cereus BAG2X1-3]